MRQRQDPGSEESPTGESELLGPRSGGGHPLFVTAALPKRAEKGTDPKTGRVKQGSATSLPPGTRPGTGDRPALPQNGTSLVGERRWDRHSGDIPGGSGPPPRSQYVQTLLDGPVRPAGSASLCPLAVVALVGNGRRGAKRGATSRGGGQTARTQNHGPLRGLKAQNSRQFFGEGFWG